MITLGHTLNDEIISSSKFRSSQSHWFSVALKRPVTITSGEDKVIVFNRDRVRELYQGNAYLKLAIKLCIEIQKGEKSTIFPWLEYLDAEERKQFQEEFSSNILISMVTDNWNTVEDLLADWEATAETKSNEEVMKALKTKIHKDQYITIK